MRRHIIIIGDPECEPCKVAVSLVRRYGVVPEIVDIRKKTPIEFRYFLAARKCGKMPFIIFIRKGEEKYLCGLNIEKLVEYIEWVFG